MHAGGDCVRSIARCFVFTLLLAASVRAQEPAAKPVFTFQEVMIPMRDGIRLQTVILAPAEQTTPLPMLLRRTPYGIPDHAPAQMPSSMKELAEDGYIHVLQNLRGRFKSEGVFKLSSEVDLKDPKATNETTDAYDTIEWLLKNVANNNGKVGIYGVSYLGLTAALTLLHPHPALKAISEQASPVDQWMNDDDHRYGALRLSYDFEYAVMEQADKNKNTNFDFETYDTYEWYLKVGPLSNLNAKYLRGKIPYWNESVEHPDYDEFWKKEAWIRQLHSSTVPNLNVAGFWDQEDPWGPWQIFRHAGEHDPEHKNFIVAGPWFHGQWQTPKGDSIGIIPFGGHETAREFRQNIEAPFFRYYLHGRGEKPNWQASTFQSGSNRWHTYAVWPPKEARRTNLYLHADGTLSFTAPSAAEAATAYREYVSDPENPVPYRQRPISPTYPGGDWQTWEVADQRFVDHRPDVLSFVSAPLDGDITITG
jgi:putative CocE/NonD family hydrolase